jgi:hypothetical protein
VLPYSRGEFVELSFPYQFSLENPVPRVLHEVEEERSTPVAGRVDMYQRIHANVEQSKLAQHARHAKTDRSINPVKFGVGVQYLQETCLGDERRIASESRWIRFV